MSCRRSRFHLAGVKRTLVSLDSPAYIEFTYFSPRKRWLVLIVCERSALWTADNKGQDRRGGAAGRAPGGRPTGAGWVAPAGGARAAEAAVPPPPPVRRPEGLRRHG